ncbi:MAG TPA: NAD(P)H-dependent glycerol-3-phosphate dehydrogenase [Nitrospiraceae bacterium]|nr:NAD(P)H-dependent glycerol-3-phosphate dehydrogenase [Nitrospiraceae bacterium]
MPNSIPTEPRVAVIGAGAWGTSLARHLANKTLPVRLWAYECEVVETIRTTHENTIFLSGVKLPSSLHVTESLEEAVQDSDLLLFAVPSHAARSVLQQLRPLLPHPIPIVSATKGIEENTFNLMSQVMQDVLPPYLHPFVCVLSGPSFAIEVCHDQPTAIVLAGQEPDIVRPLQHVFMTPCFRVYAGTDVIGVQLGGALKNVMALAAGVVDGLNLGHNARAALITRGLAEMIRLGVALGADPKTFYGLSGVGDLVLTCTGPLSRNHTVGVRLGRGETLPDILKETQAVAEGVRTSSATAGLARRHKIEMPIVQAVCAVLFEGKSPRGVVSELMERAAKDETEC